MLPIITYCRLGMMTGMALSVIGTMLPAEARTIVDTMGERFASVTLQSGQNARVTVANVLVPAKGATPTACPVLVRFFGPDGNLLGSEKEIGLTAGASTSIAAEAPFSRACARHR